jgi:hypothetical protein
MIAARTGNVDALKVLLDAGAAVNARDHSQETALMRAVKGNNADAVRRLSRHSVPLDAEHIFKIRARSAGLGVGAGAEAPELEVTLDGTRVKALRTAGSADLHITIKAGPHSVGVALPHKKFAGIETFERAIEAALARVPIVPGLFSASRGNRLA